MGNVNACCGDRKEIQSEPTINLVTMKLEDEIYKANEAISTMLAEQATMNGTRTNLLENSCKPSRHAVKPFYKRILAPEEYKKINLGPFLGVDDMSTVDLTELVAGVAYTSQEVFELNDGSIYKGEFDSEGHQHGRGVIIMPNGSRYIGYFNHGHIQGQGRLMTKDGKLYQGNFISTEVGTRSGENAVLNGLGKEIWPNGMKYKGEFSNGIKSGEGELTTKDFKYIGGFQDDEYSGQGTMIWKDEKKYSGGWAKGLMHGKGVFSWPSGKVFEGEYVFNEKSGKGTMKWPDGKIYEGQWKDGKQDGVGIYTYFDKNKERFRSSRGEWAEGNRLRWLSPNEKN